ncbi:MAG: PKD domain-containing protein, partial [Thermoplasmata archaeon]|nr:PKD domain-containing protein [Thermoplasmata archaeon]
GTNLYLNDTWMFHSGAWSAVAATPNPGHRYSYISDDPADGGVALYGGIVCVTGCNFAPSEMQWTDTWLWSAAPPLSDIVALAVPAHDSSGEVVAAVPATSEVGLSINFSVSYRGGVPPTTVQWGFDDGTTGTGASLSHAFHTAGPHAVSVWINDSYGHRTRSFANVTVSSGFAVAPSASVNPGDAGTPITFAANPSGGGATTPTFNWTFGDGSTGTTSAPVHTYAAAGNYTVTLNATDSLGVTATGSVLLHVRSALRIVRLNVTPTPVVLGIPENFSTVLSGGTTPFVFAWVFGDGGIGGNLPNITHIYTTNGPFVATVQVTDGAGASISSFLNLSIALAASVIANGSIGAAPLLLAFTPNVTGGIPTYSYAWNFGDGQTSVLPAPTHLFGSVGAYNVTLTVRDRAGHSAQGLWGLEVFTGQGALQLQVGVSAPVLTVGQSSTLTAEPHGGVGRYVYQWSSVPTGCREVSLLVLSCAPSTNGTYAASGTLTDGAGTIVTASGTFKVGSGGNPPLTAPSERLGPWLYPALL